MGKISKKLSERIEKETGLKIGEKNVSLSANEIRKIFNSHGDDVREQLRGQRAITINDILSIPDIIEEADTIELVGKYTNGNNMLSFGKNKNGYIRVLGYDSKKHFRLVIQTMYSSIKNKSIVTPIDEQASINTPEAQTLIPIDLFQ